MFALKNKIRTVFRSNEPLPTEELPGQEWSDEQDRAEPVRLPRPAEGRNLDNVIDQTLERFPKTLQKLAA